MRILAIETVETTGSVALLDDARLIAGEALVPQSKSAQFLAPAIHALLGEAGWRPSDVELVAVATGPGSFTGLRIGVTVAKVFAYSIGCEVIGVSTMTAIAARVPHEIERFSVVVDAQRNELFVADFTREENGRLAGEQTTRLVDAAEWIAALAPGTVVTGPGLRKWRSQLGSAVVVVDEPLWLPRAIEVGRVGWQAFAAGKRTSGFELVPQYFRRAAAEEKRQKAEGRRQDN